MPKVISVIESDVVRGKGRYPDLMRSVMQYHTLHGELLAERDPVAENIVDRCTKPNIELLAQYVHDAWWQESKRQGREGEQSMVPYSELPDNVKEYDRVTVRTVLDALRG